VAITSLGYCPARIRPPRRWTGSFGAAWPVLAELGRTRLRRTRDLDRRATQRGRHYGRRRPRLIDECGDERQVIRKARIETYPFRIPMSMSARAAVLPKVSRSAVACCATRRSCGSEPESRVRRDSSASTTSRTSGPSKTSSGTYRMTPQPCSKRPSCAPAVTWTRFPQGRHRLLQSGVERRSGSQSRHCRRPLDPS
jgi:hypothetical protein